MSGIIKISRNTRNSPAVNASTQTVAFSHYNNISAQLPVDPKTGEVVAGDVKDQTKQCLENIKAILKDIGHVMDDVVKINIFIGNIEDADPVDEVYKTFFKGYFPARTTVAVAGLPLNAMVQMDAISSNGEGTPPQAPSDLVKLAKNTSNAPVNSVSTQSVAFSHYNNISAQLPVDPKTDEVIAGGVKEQAGQCLRNLKAILESIDVPFDDIVKVNIYLKNISDIEAVNEVYKTFFPDSAIARSVGYVPARTTVAASALPMDVLVQIDAVVSHGDGTPPQAVEDRHGIVIRTKNTDNAPQSPFYAQTVAFSHYSHIAAQLPLDTKTGELIAGGVKEQAEQCLRNIKAIVENDSHTMDDVVKVNIYLKNIEDIDAVDQVYPEFFNGDFPARTVIGVAAILMDALVQVDAVVSNGEGTPPA